MDMKTKDVQEGQGVQTSGKRDKDWPFSLFKNYSTQIESMSVINDIDNEKKFEGKKVLKMVFDSPQSAQDFADNSPDKPAPLFCMGNKIFLGEDRCRHMLGDKVTDKLMPPGKIAQEVIKAFTVKDNKPLSLGIADDINPKKVDSHGQIKKVIACIFENHDAASVFAQWVESITTANPPVTFRGNTVLLGEERCKYLLGKCTFGEGHKKSGPAMMKALIEEFQSYAINYLKK